MLEVFDELLCDFQIVGFSQELRERQLLVDRTVRFVAGYTIKLWTRMTDEIRKLT